MTKTAYDLTSRLGTFIAHGRGDFSTIVREVFVFQFENNPLYRRHCERRGVTPSTFRDWRELPAVPTSAFKDFDVSCFPVSDAVAEYHTSGTTQGRPGRHFFRTLELYDTALAPQFAAHLLPDEARLPAVCLTSRPADAPHSSLVYMLDVVTRAFATNTTWYVHHDLLRAEALVADLAACREPVLLLGTAFAFVHLFDHCAARGVRLTLPTGSRAMETGGFKGRSRAVEKPALYGLFEKHLGLPAAQVVNEYGMTELSTQFYDATLRTGLQTDEKPVPPWARVVAVNPQTGDACPPGEAGLLRVVDLANLWSCAVVQTEDLGTVAPDGMTFTIHGRRPGAAVRGCSLTAEGLRVA